MPDDDKQALERTRLLEAVNAAYAALRQDPDAWEEELAERAVWDANLVPPDWHKR